MYVRVLLTGPALVLVGGVTLGRKKAFNTCQICHSDGQHQGSPPTGIDFLLIVLVLKYIKSLDCFGCIIG